MTAYQSTILNSRHYGNRQTFRRYLDLSHFSPNAVLRGVQLTLVGGQLITAQAINSSTDMLTLSLAQRALQNPALFTSDHYRHAAYAVAAGVVIRFLMEIPISFAKVCVWVISVSHPDYAMPWVGSVTRRLEFIGEHVLQLPLLLMAMMRHFSPTLDNLFMLSLRWVDITYVMKHQGDLLDKSRFSYYTNLEQYSPVIPGISAPDNAAYSLPNSINRHCRKALVSIAIYALSYLPVIGPIVLPLVSFYTFHKAVGLGLAGLIFGSSLLFPRTYLVIFLQTYFSTRTFTRELLEPYFSRVKFTSSEKRNWFRSREGVLFGFGLGFYILLKIPLVGVLIYGIAEASTAYLITKITDPPPPPEQYKEFTKSQQKWKNRQRFLNTSLYK
ncbi:hypothetical protein L249_7448 [Ophiocordyceps polyrhachis-furcata BCC 54312]|uniref:Transmembrane protein UsgS n=1 Tax=Ophiocordyceps polyrhachis-furcata BCC 54312 TaxID=1330021 RepID=A0A367L9M5_9HYPO|nr:hypothetical protein L249_7448 [Ophiocordyceps polyrhachis-furcata BCC 54312]